MKYLLIISIILGLVSCSETQDKSKQNEVTGDSDKIEIATDTLQESNIESKIDSSLIVIDTSSNLMWMKNDFSYIKGRFLYDWNEIFEWENEINLVKYAGLNDWRVPSIKDYRSINKNKSDRKKHSTLFNYIDSASVWGKGPYAYWSRTTPNKHTASYISFIDGFATSGNRDKQFSSLYSSYNGVELGMSVRLVRNDK
jgi:hypothetical protein